VARIAAEKSGPLFLRPGSRLALAGVFVGSGRKQNPNEDNKSFELLVNSPTDIAVLSQPPWWTLPRLFIVVGVLLVILTFTVIWNTQLRRLVEQRTDQLQHEIHERERVERQHALEAERSRIARDLHDDLGSSLTEISVLASSGQLRHTSADHQPTLFQAIGAKARGLISALDVIVWAVDPEDNSLQSLADYLSGYADDFFSHTKIDCRFKVPVSFPPVTLEGRLRHELLMAVKEGLNNIVRHSEATEVEFRMALADKCLEIAIADNGKGIEHETAGDGHGLKNLSARLEKMGGNCTVESRLGGGTVVKFQLPLAANGYASLNQSNRQ
jgi:signal transduction histidine kinase